MFCNNHKEYLVKKYMAFTLAEVLVTLVVIGVVAALTIPALVQGLQKDQYVLALRKAQSELTQAYNELKMDGGGDITYIFSDTGASAMNYFADKLSVSKNCGNAMGCWYQNIYYLNGNIIYSNYDTLMNSSHYGKAVLADGSLVAIYNYNNGCTHSEGSGILNQSICGSISIDINGNKGPNTIGRDWFVFWIAKPGVYPFGTNGDGYGCDPSTGTSNSNDGCAGKVLKEGAMNY